MRPAIYGYLRATAVTLTDGPAERTRRELAEYAEREGFTLDNVFTEQVECSESAFNTMLDALKRGEVRHMVVPSLEHFTHLSGLQDAIRQHVRRETGACIWVVRGQR